jgi:hypothetical protein
MSKKRSRRPRLVDRDYEIFEHVMRYRLTTREVLQRLFFADSELNAVTKVTSRLVKDGFLNRYDLYPSRAYFTLGRKSASFLGVAYKKTRELGPLSKAREFGVLSYCCMTERLRERLTVHELSQKHPELLQGGLDNSHYYLDNDGEVTRLAYIRVDLGGSVDHILRNCRDDIAERLRFDAFEHLMNNGRFAIAIVTARAEKVEKIREATNERQDWPVAFRVEAVPELVELVTHLYDDV